MADSSQTGVAENNRQQQEKAIGLLYQLIQQSLVTNSRVREITIRIAVHGNRLGAPRYAVEKE